MALISELQKRADIVSDSLMILLLVFPCYSEAQLRKILKFLSVDFQILFGLVIILLNQKTIDYECYSNDPGTIL